MRHLSLVGKVYMVYIWIKRIGEGIEGIVCEEQCGFRRGRSCVNQVFAIRQVCRIFLAKGKE